MMGVRCHRVGDLSQLLHIVRNIHALVPVCEHDGAEQGAIPVQHVGMHRISNYEILTRHHAHAVENGHEPPHVGVVAIHVAKILAQPKRPCNAVREVMQYFGSVCGNRIN